MNYFIDIDNSNNIVIHETNCDILNIFGKSFVPEFYDTYEEALKYAHQKELIYKFISKNCEICLPDINYNKS